MRLRHLAAINPPTPEFDALPDDAELPFIPLEAVWPNGRLDVTQRRTKGAVATGYTRFREGDVVVPKITPTFQADRTTIATPISGGVAAGTTELHIVRPGRSVDRRYVRYLLSSKEFLDLGEASMIGVAGQKRVPDQCLRDLPVPLTDIDEQRRIADFLDAETARIDALIAKKRRMIHLLHEANGTDISRTTTHGVPTPVRRVTSLITSGPRGWSERTTDEGVAFVRAGDLQRNSLDIRSESLARVPATTSPEARRSAIATGDVVIGITGANTGWVGRIRAHDPPGFISQHVALLRPKGIDPAWLAFSVASQRTQQHLFAGQYGGTKQQLGLQDLASVRIAVPDRAEQSVRVADLEERLSTRSLASEKLDRQIELLSERRQALITHVVTGQLSVAA